MTKIRYTYYTTCWQGFRPTRSQQQKVHVTPGLSLFISFCNKKKQRIPVKMANFKAIVQKKQDEPTANCSARKLRNAKSIYKSVMNKSTSLSVLWRQTGNNLHQ